MIRQYDAVRLFEDRARAARPDFVLSATSCRRGGRRVPAARRPSAGHRARRGPSERVERRRHRGPAGRPLPAPAQGHAERPSAPSDAPGRGRLEFRAAQPARAEPVRPAVGLRRRLHPRTRPRSWVRRRLRRRDGHRTSRRAGRQVAGGDGRARHRTAALLAARDDAGVRHGSGSTGPASGAPSVLGTPPTTSTSSRTRDRPCSARARPHSFGCSRSSSATSGRPWHGCCDSGRGGIRACTWPAGSIRCGIATATTRRAAGGSPGPWRRTRPRRARARARALDSAAGLALIQGDHETAGAEADPAAALSRQIGDRAGLAQALTTRGLAAIYADSVPDATAILQEALRLARTAGDLHAEAASIVYLMTAFLAAGDYDRTRQLSDEADDPARPHRRPGRPGMDPRAPQRRGMAPGRPRRRDPLATAGPPRLLGSRPRGRTLRRHLRLRPVDRRNQLGRRDRAPGRVRGTPRVGRRRPAARSRVPGSSSSRLARPIGIGEASFERLWRTGTTLPTAAVVDRAMEELKRPRPVARHTGGGRRPWTTAAAGGSYIGSIQMLR